MLSLIGTLLSFIPGVMTLVNKYYEQRANLQMAQLGADKDVAVATIQAQAQIDEGRAKLWGAVTASRLLTWLVVGIATPVGIYVWKVVVIDNVIGPGCLGGWCWVGTTDPIKGAVGEWMGTVILSLFGSATALAAVQHWWTTRP